MPVFQPIHVVVQLLQIGEVRRIQLLDQAGIQLRQPAEPGDNPRQQDHDQVRGVLHDPGIPERHDFIRRRGAAHHAIAMQRSFFVHIAARQGELEFGLQHGYLTRSTPS